MYITLEQAAELEGINYDTYRKKVQRNKDTYNIKQEENENGGKPRIYIHTENLSKKARKLFKELNNIDVADMVVKQLKDNDMPWYVGYDLQEYINNNSKYYYEAVEYAKHIEACVNYQGSKDKTGYVSSYAKELGKPARTFRRHMQHYLEGQAWALKMSNEDGCNYDFYKILALCRKPRQAGEFRLQDEVKAFIENLWFHKDFAMNLGTRENLYEKLQLEADEYGWQCTSYATVCRYINYLMEVKRYKNAYYLQQKGIREYRNQKMVKGRRNTKSIPVMGLVQGDEHTFDCWVKFKHPNGKIVAIKPTLVSWIDTRTRVLLSYVICNKANSGILKKSLYKMLVNYNCCPQWLLIDNGKDYTAETMTGRKRNERVSFDSETVGFYRSIGIKDDIRSIPYQPWSKAQQERFYGTVCNKFTKWMGSYTGTLTGSKTFAKVKKDIPKMLKEDKLISMEKFYELFETWVETKYHMTEHGGLKEMKEKWVKPMELFNNCEDKYYKPAPPQEYMTMLMMKCERVHVYNVGIKKFGYWYRSLELTDYIGEKVDIRYNEDDVTKLYVYTRKGIKIGEVVSQELLDIAPKISSKALTEHIKMQRSQEKRDKARAKEMTTPLHQRVENHNAHHNVAGYIIQNNPPAGQVDNVVTLVTDSQYRQEIKAKKANKTRNTDFFNQEAKEALNILKNLG
ncbi:Mu transposase C-terminal domain-containing protein [Vallitalea guaymasensis]|uniref:Mu transposase C-terminal domain-containing protein n=1 Tax=Vallitalea guaymasensis TaxID=1185412 RepID=UPI000DE4BDD1|nr:Mu transposase C-terminal domain-containing protein [Vallitalea guaymasensis]